MFDINTTRQDWVSIESLALDTSSARDDGYTTVDCLTANTVIAVDVDAPR